MKFKAAILALLLTSGSLVAFSQAGTTYQPIAKDTLVEGRKQIDSIDHQLISLLAARERVVQEIGQYKKDHHIPPLQPARYQEVLEKVGRQGAAEGLSEDFVKRIFDLIHEESLKLEK